MFGHAETGVDPQEIRALLTKKDALAKQVKKWFKSFRRKHIDAVINNGAYKICRYQ